MATDVATLDGAQTTLSDETLEELRGGLRGPALEASDPGLAEVRGPFNAMHEGRAALTVRCSGTADVVDAVNLAREQGLSVGVRGGGHSVAGLSVVDGGILIDLSGMQGVHVDQERRLAIVQGGALWGDVDRETQRFGLATPGGVVSETGVAGLTLGGGYGWLRRKYGLSCDNVVEAQVVCADGEVRKASPDSNPDLYWGIRGGGGNFGIVTSFTFRLHPVGPIVAFVGTFYPIEEAADVLRGWRAYLTDAPDEVTTELVTITFPPDPEMPTAVHDRPVAILGAVYAGDPEEGMRRLQPLRELGTPLADLSQPMPFTAVQSAFDPLFPRGELQAYWKSLYLNELSEEAIELIATKALDRPGPMTLVNVFHMGGAVNSVGPEETAFAERSAEFMVSIDGNWTDPADNDDHVAWVRSTWEEIGKLGTGGVYLNFTGLAGEIPSAGVDSAFGRNLRRLAEVKASYDANNLFRVNNNIPPAS